MSFEEVAKSLVNSGLAEGVALVDASGNVVWKWPEDWNPPVSELLSGWRSQEPGVLIGGVRFSVLERTDDKFVASSVSGGGVWIVMKHLTRKGQLIVVKFKPGIDVMSASLEASRLRTL